MADPVLCIYHGNCADGFGAAWAVRGAFVAGEVEFHAGVYQQPPPDVAGRRVVLVDFSYPRDVIEQMARVAQSVLIIDHHKSAAEALSGYPEPPDAPDEYLAGWLPDSGVWARFDMDRSGAMLAWQHFHGRAEPPALLLHIEDRDLWRFRLPGTREIQAALFSYPYEFGLWDSLMRMPADRLRQDGVAIERKHHKDVAELVAVTRRPMIIGALSCPSRRCRTP